MCYTNGVKCIETIVEGVVEQLLMNSPSALGILSAVFIDPERAKPITFEDIMKVRDSWST